ncbi:LLM class flavin-dependent oxidoreductase [Saccharopolyspora cebuensis]|uniref:LLM class flavin-dependent oxidoreductase n=1 Tax=Saccharopolyspora cebuensis TaxID=418759 RepID=A0ABV4CBT0_9PSEU
MTIRLSVLDRSHTRRGVPAPEALRETVEFARAAEEAGYHRFWVAEHHSVPGIAGAAPAVLATAVAGATSRIRVGTGGVMLPNHAPLVVAEQFGVLGSLFPGRIDLGLGRSVGFTSGIRRALGRGTDAAEDYPAQVAELLGYFTGAQRVHPGVRAVAAQGQRPEPFLLATGSGADHAADLGLPVVVVAAHGEERLLETIRRYRARFRPSPWADSPHVVLARSIAVADTAELAEDLLVPEAWAGVHSRRHGEFPPLEPPEAIRSLSMTDRERHQFERALRGHLFGTEREVALGLEELVERTGADEVLVTTSGYDQRQRRDSYRRLAALVG